MTINASGHWTGTWDQIRIFLRILTELSECQLIPDPGNSYVPSSSYSSGRKALRRCSCRVIWHWWGTDCTRHDFWKNSLFGNWDVPGFRHNHEWPAEPLPQPAHSDRTEWKLKAWSSVRNFRISSTVIFEKFPQTWFSKNFHWTWFSKNFVQRFCCALGFKAIGTAAWIDFHEPQQFNFLTSARFGITDSR